MARRGENIYKRKDGRWEARLLVQKGKYKYFYGKSYKEAKIKMRTFQENAKNYRDKQEEQKKSASGLLESWLETQVSNRVKPLTYESYYHCMYKHILPYFQHEPDDRITKETVLGFTKNLTEDTFLADTSRKKILTVLKIALKDILKDDLNRASILEAIKLPKIEMREVEVFSLKEQRCLEAAALGAKDQRALGIVLCLYTGIRLGELCALTWKDIDWENGLMSITKTVSRTKVFNPGRRKTELVVGTPKSRNSMRKIPVPRFLLKLVEQRKLCEENDNTYILTGKDTPLDPRNFQKLYKKLLMEEHLPNHKFHAIRHTFATRGLELGVDIKTLSEILGHSNVSITLNIYTHSLIEQKKAAIEKYNTMYTAVGDLSKFAV
ncbi:tyrosine-type recombinase/integrase [Anaerotignum sp.]|uniref:tyrosine-type recombinase/integrase n=1 Tax=Anaerotignum sp. TaxID=2039241 RepID=UPI0027146EA2|nr:site-specific integrase [Anaerotignum sp.]